MFNTSHVFSTWVSYFRQLSIWIPSMHRNHSLPRWSRMVIIFDRWPFSWPLIQVSSIQSNKSNNCTNNKTSNCSTNDSSRGFVFRWSTYIGFFWSFCRNTTVIGISKRWVKNGVFGIIEGFSPWSIGTWVGLGGTKRIKRTDPWSSWRILWSLWLIRTKGVLRLVRT